MKISVPIFRFLSKWRDRKGLFQRYATRFLPPDEYSRVVLLDLICSLNLRRSCQIIFLSPGYIAFRAGVEAFPSRSCLFVLITAGTSLEGM